MGPHARGPATLVGQIIGGYRLDRVLGIGATGAVFLGRRETVDAALPEEAAIKILILPWQLDDAEREKFRARFQREAETLRRLHDPQHSHHLVPVLASGEEAGYTYMVLSYMAGGTLAAWLTAGPLPLQEVASYLAQLADALDYAHSHHIVHRDIKPANVLLDAAGQAYLADFGIVHLIQSTSTGLTSTGRVLGTLPYMAPEQFTGDPITPATDVYSLGVVLYQMVTGRLPFVSEVPAELVHQHVFEVPIPPQRVRPDLPTPAAVAIQRALAKVPANRFASAGALAHAFSAGLHGEGPASVSQEELSPDLKPSGNTTVASFNPAPTASASIPSPVRRIRRSAFLPGLAALLIVALFGGLLARLAGLSIVLPGMAGTATATSGSTSTQPVSQNGGTQPAGISTTTVGSNPGQGTPSPGPRATSTPGTQPTATPSPTFAPTNTPVPTPHFSQFGLPTPSASPYGITAGPDGAVWFVEGDGNKIGRISTDGSISEFSLPFTPGHPVDIASGSDGALWFTGPGSNVAGYIGRITTGGTITQFAIPSADGAPIGIAAGPDGALWFAEADGNKIGRITTSGSVTEFAIPTAGSSPYYIAAGSDGALWFTESAGHKIGRITTGGSITEFAVTVAPFYIAAGPDGALWFTDYYSDGVIGRITTGGSTSEFTIPTPNSFPLGIVAGPDGAVWFTESATNKIGRITTLGNMVEFAVPTTNSGIDEITAGPDGGLWFTEDNSNSVGRVTCSNCP